MSKEFKLKEDGYLLTPTFRVSFPYLFKTNDYGFYTVKMIFDEDTDFSVFEDTLQEVIADKWLKGAKKDLMLPLMDGDDANRPELEGKMHMNAKSKFQPLIVDRQGVDILDEGELYAGCYARAVIGFYAYENKKVGKAGVSLSLRSIQKVKEGEPFTKFVKASDEFDALDDNGVADL